MTDWKITKRQSACSACQHAFAEGELHFSSLLLRAELLMREDACTTCWRNRGATGGAAPAALVGESIVWWRTRQRSDRRRAVALNLEALEALFVQLDGRTEVALRELRYVLCLILMRKRRLKMERIYRDASGEGMVVRRPRRDEAFEVAVFDFTPERIDELRTRLREVFEGVEGFPATLGGSTSLDVQVEQAPASA
jgi:hypothetical protein